MPPSSKFPPPPPPPSTDNADENEDPARRRCKFLWCDDSDEELAFQIIDGKYQMIVEIERPLLLDS